MAVSESRTGPVGAEKKMSAPKRSSLERSRSEKNMIESRFVGQAQARKTEALRRTDHILSAQSHRHTHTHTYMYRTSRTELMLYSYGDPYAFDLIHSLYLFVRYIVVYLYSVTLYFSFRRVL